MILADYIRIVSPQIERLRALGYSEESMMVGMSTRHHDILATCCNLTYMPSFLGFPIWQDPIFPAPTVFARLDRR